MKKTSILALVLGAMVLAGCEAEPTPPTAPPGAGDCTDCSGAITDGGPGQVPPRQVSENS
jgi:hypothetical protein